MNLPRLAFPHLAVPAPAIPQPRVLREWNSTRSTSDWPTPPSGNGRPAILIPGFLAGDPSLARLARWLRDGGFLTSRSGIAWNVDCMEATLGRLEEGLEGAVERAGKRALVVGQSRGGTIGRALSVRRPDLIETLVTLGSPLGNQLGVHPQHWIPIGIVGLLGTIGVPGLFTLSCVRGECCARCRDELVAPFPDRVRFLAFYSRSDEVVRWETCLEPDAMEVEVSSSHVGMAMDVEVWRRLGAELA